MSTPSDTPEIQPALTKGQWETLERHGVIEGYVDICDGPIPTPIRAPTHKDRHALAALALHDHPAGFTWEDVEELRGVAEDYDGEPAQQVSPTLRYLADRIAALLPPREETL